MKKLLYLLLLLPLGFMASCSDDKDFPEVDVTTSFSGGTFHNDTIYTVVGDTLRITGITARPLEGTKNAAVTNVFMWLNYRQIYPTVPLLEIQQFPALIASNPGKNLLQVGYTLLQEDKTLTTWQSGYIVKVVPEIKDLPAGAPEIGDFSLTLSIHNQ